MALVVLTGGARSGKSRIAQRLAIDLADRGHGVTVVVFGTPGDPEMSARIERHREDRPDAFAVIEVAGADESWLEVLAGEDAVLVDCVGSCVSQIMAAEWERIAGVAPDADENGPLPSGYAEAVERRVAGIVEALAAGRGARIVVTNEVGEGVVPEWASARLFRDVMGRANARLIAASDGGYLCVAGRAVDIRGLPGHVIWPED